MKKMMVLVACLVGLLTAGQAQDMVADFLKKQKNPDVFTQVNISRKMFQLLADMSDSETEGIIQNLTGMRIITGDQEPDVYFRTAREMLESSPDKYESLMNIKEEKEEVWMFIREEKGSIVELVILVGDNGEFVLMNFTGKIDLKKIARLTKSVNIDGIEYLNKVDDSTRNKSKDKQSK